jgi:glycosyltransferase involved in cell wall biosynthesis
MTSSGDYAGTGQAGEVPAEPRVQEQAGEAGTAARAHVLLVCDKAGWERTGPIIRRLTVGLVDEAVRISLVCDRDCPASAGLPGLQATYSLQRRSYFDIFNPARRFEELTEYAQRTHLTCIHAASISCLETAVDLKRVLNIPLLVTVDTTDDDMLAFLADLLGPDCIAAAMSERIREALLSRGRSTARKSEFIQVIRPGIHAQERAQPPFEPGSPVTILVLEPPARGHGLATILQAAAQLLQDGINVMLFFINSGPAETHLRRIALQLQIHEHIIFTGKFMRWPQTLGAADVVILPEPQKQVHLYPLEAMASGTLVVAARGHCYDTIVDGKTGVEFEPGRGQDLVEKLGRALRDPHQARQLAYTARERIRRDHSVSQMVSAYVALYGRVGSTENG